MKIRVPCLIADFEKNREENELVTYVFVRNLDITVMDKRLQEPFAAHGTVEAISIIKDRDTGRTGGIAFAEMTPRTLFCTRWNDAKRRSDERERSSPEASPISNARFGSKRTSATQDVSCELGNYSSTCYKMDSL